MKISIKRKIEVNFKRITSKIVLFFLYRGFKVLYHYDNNLKQELDALDDKLSIRLQLQKNDYSLILLKDKNKIKRIKDKNNKNNKKENSNKEDIIITFKSIDSAFIVLTGRAGIAHAYARHSFTLKGDISKAMALVRCINIVEAYLFPKILTKNILKEIPHRNLNIFSTYFHVMFDLDFLLNKN